MQKKLKGKFIFTKLKTSIELKEVDKDCFARRHNHWNFGINFHWNGSFRAIEAELEVCQKFHERQFDLNKRKSIFFC